MQIIENDGTTRDLTDYELLAIQQAQQAHIEEEERNGIFEQYDKDTALGKIIGAMVNSVDIPVEDAVRLREYYPRWVAGKTYKVGDKINWSDSLWRCLQEHTSQEDWKPHTTPSIWAKVLITTDPETGEQIVSEWVQPDSTNPYQAGDRVTHNGRTWASIVSNNVWEPGVYGWEEVS